MMNYRRVLSFVLTSAAIAGGIVACSAGAPETTESSSGALACGFQCGKPPDDPPVPPHIPLQSCVTPGYFCDGPGTNAVGVFDPVMIPGTGAGAVYGYVPDPSFTAILTTGSCGIEHYFEAAGGWWWATAACSSDITASVNAYGAAHSGVAGVVPCTTCTPDPTLDQVVVAWMFDPGITQWCGDGGQPDGEPPRCTQPGQGCKSITCLKG